MKEFYLPVKVIPSGGEATPPTWVYRNFSGEVSGKITAQENKILCLKLRDLNEQFSQVMLPSGMILEAKNCDLIKK